MSCTAPVSLLAAIMLTSAVPGPAVTASRRLSGSTSPASSTPTSTCSPPRRAAAVRAESSTAGCSRGEVTTRGARTPAARAARARPVTTSASASVPPEVNSTSCGSTSSAAASRARARASIAPTRRPDACWAAGFAHPPRPSRRSAATCSATSGRTGVVAAWSR